MVIPPTVNAALQRARAIKTGTEGLLNGQSKTWTNEQKQILVLLLEITTQLQSAVSQIVDANK